MSSNEKRAETETEIPANNKNVEEENLEDLLRNLHKQIKTTNWLEENSVEKIEKDNPELIKAWNDAIASSSQPNEQQQKST